MTCALGSDVRLEAYLERLLYPNEFGLKWRNSFAIVSFVLKNTMSFAQKPTLA